MSQQIKLCFWLSFGTAQCLCSACAAHQTQLVVHVKHLTPCLVWQDLDQYSAEAFLLSLRLHLF